jgi:hypothetical protein
MTSRRRFQTLTTLTALSSALLLVAPQAHAFDHIAVMTHLDGAIRPGLKVAAHWLISEKTETKTVEIELENKTEDETETEPEVRTEVRTTVRTRTFGPSLGGWVHPGISSQAFAEIGALWRIQRDEPTFREFGLGLGAMHTAYAIDVVVTDDRDGSITQERSGQSLARVSGSFGLGRPLTQPLRGVTAWFVRSEATLIFPYNAGFVPLISLQAGLEFGQRGKNGA